MDDTNKPDGLNDDENINDIENNDALSVNDEVSEVEIVDHHDEPTSHLRGMMDGYFMEFASYVIKDRAIPDIDDGFKPVQRRIFHTLHRSDDGKYHKVANIVGSCMQFHPHGDSSIYGALVNLANKEFFIDRQGNFGNVLTGDNASAARYIECRLNPLAREVLFNPEVTSFVDSYDGRNKEPIALPAKVPVLLMQGTEGIAVGMATRLLSHNFNELLKAQIEILKGKRIRIYPDFIQGGMMDVSEYKDGHGKVIVRAKIEKLNKKTLVIRQVPPSTTTESLIESIEGAVKNGKVKLASISDYTAEEIEIELKLSRGIDADQTLEALYAFTNCEMSLSSNPTVIRENVPVVLSVPEILHHNTQRLVDILRAELEIEKAKLEDKIQAKTLEQIFIENRIYKRIEECRSNEEVVEAVYIGLEPFKDQLWRPVTDDDVERLLRIPIRRISLFDIEKSRREVEDLLAALEAIKAHLADLKTYTINFIKGLLKKYGKDYPRRTEIKSLEKIDKKAAALANVKVGVDRRGGYIGAKVVASDPLMCTEFDRLLTVYRDGRFKVMDIPDKLFTGRLFDAFIADKKQVFSIVYEDKKTGHFYAKRATVSSYILEKEYQLFPAGCRLELMETNYGVTFECVLEDTSKSKGETVLLDFEDIPKRGATARGVKFAPRKIVKFKRQKRGRESMHEEVEEVEETTEEKAKRVMGWRSETDIRFTPPISDEAQKIAAENDKASDIAIGKLKASFAEKPIDTKVSETKVEEASQEAVVAEVESPVAEVEPEVEVTTEAESPVAEAEPEPEVIAEAESPVAEAEPEAEEVAVDSVVEAEEATPVAKPEVDERQISEEEALDEAIAFQKELLAREKAEREAKAEIRKKKAKLAALKAKSSRSSNKKNGGLGFDDPNSNPKDQGWLF